jgi:hypothetical protein
MTSLLYSPAAARYFKKMKDAQLKAKFEKTILMIQEDYTVT